MSSQPVLETIRAVLKFKSAATIAEIASLAGMKRLDVLRVINANLDLIKRDVKRGRIVSLDLQGPLRRQLWDSGKFWQPDTYGAWSVEGRCIRLADCEKELAERLTKQQIVGGFGDSYYVGVIHLTPENIASVEAKGIRPWSEADVDDRLWKEPVDG
jgi:hypothetical protein